MKVYGTTLQRHIDSGSTTLAIGLKITRPDGQVFAYTSHDRNALISGVTYLAQPGLEVGQITTTSGGAVGNMELTSMRDENIFEVDEILQGIWRNSSFELFRYNWNTLGDPYYSYVKALLHFDGVDGSTTFTDEKGHTFTRQGTTEKISTEQKRFGTASYRQSVITGTSYIQSPTTADWNLGSGDFTFEAWIYVESYNDGSNAGRAIGSIRNTGADGIAFVIGSGGQLYLRANIGGSWLETYMPTPNGVVPLNKWTYVAWSRTGSTWKCFVNGRQRSTVTNAGAISFSSTPFTIGSAASVNEQRFLGWIDEVRLTKGLGRYTADFGPTTQGYYEPNISETDVLLVGTLGEIAIHKNKIVAELRDLKQYLQQPFGSVTSKTCRYRLGDDKCGFNLEAVTIPLADDYAWDSIKTLLHFEGSDGSTTITDSGPVPKTWTCAGNAQIDTGQFKYGSSAAQFDGAGDYIWTADHTDFELGTSDFTIELWIRPTSVTSGTILQKRASSATIGGFWLGFYSGLTFYMTSNGSSWDMVSNASFGVLVVNTWYHVAISRKGTHIRGFLDGVMKWSKLILATTAMQNNTAQVWLGNDTGLDASYNGWIDDFRFTKGAARYTRDFTPPAATHPDAKNPATASVTSVSSRQVFTDSAQAQAADYFGNGWIQWLTGDNVGVTVKIKSFSAGQFTLMMPLMNSIQIGDTYKAAPGCRGRFDNDCITKWNNERFFGGEPHRPKADDLTKAGGAT